jgi:pyruvate dehydrogenase kinase 2/3/4
MVSDIGDGMNGEQLDHAFDYIWSTAERPEKVMTYAGATVQNDPLTGLGIGLPMCAKYMQYFGGDMQLMSMEGEGTHTLITLGGMSVCESLSVDRTRQQ